ncbi:beta-lactamase family protein [Flavobacteriaceae bacterium F08102]|nr:beta-lactamase family protein [Flavobacteriaceae bacterium F08102]
MKTKFLLFLLVISHLSVAQKIKSDRIDQARSIAQTFLTEQQIPGMAIAVMEKGKIIWSEGFGYSNVQQQKSVDPASTQFRLASISKPLTAYGLAILADQIKLNFDESIYHYIPNFPKKKYDFTIRQVGGRLAGIRHYKETEFLLNKKMTIEEGLSIFKNDPLLFKPGDRFSYNTYGWNLLSVIIQNVANLEFNQFMRDHVFHPLKMHATQLDESDQEMPLRTQFYIKTNQGKIIKGPKVSNEYKVAGGGFLGTVEDLIKFGHEVLHPTLISITQRNELIKTQVTNKGKSVPYGIGFTVEKTVYGHPKYAHSGGGVGASMLLLMYPKQDLVIVLLTNLSSAPISALGTALEKHFLPN